MLYDFGQFVISSAEFLPLSLMLHIHLTILASFISVLITSSSSTSQVSLPYVLMLGTPVECKLLLASKDKSLLSNNGTESLNLLHPLVILVTILSTAYSAKGFLIVKETGHFVLCLDNSLLCLFTYVWHLNLLSSFILPLIPVHLSPPGSCKTGQRWNYYLHSFCKQHNETLLLL